MTTAPEEPTVTNIDEWLKENEQFFLPPVCNKMIYQKGQMKAFFVGGPNQRKDYHIDCGEELFYMCKGDMLLKVVEKGVHKNIYIKEGEMFLLPGYIQHSPNRVGDTIGLVLERERHPTEKDGLRYFVEKDGKPTHESLFEKWFHCKDLGSELKPIIQEFFASEQFRTGKPIPGTIPECPIPLDTTTTLEPPFHFDSWIKEHRSEIDSNGKKEVFPDATQFKVMVYGPGTNTDFSDIAETWIWQWEGTSIVNVEGKEYTLKTGDNMLVPVGQRFTIKQQEFSICWTAYQDPRNCVTWPKSE